MKVKPEVYLFGQVLGTHSFLLKDGFLQPDEYSEIGEQYFLPGGETGTAATVLSSLGVSVRMDGTWIGTEVGPMLRAFYEDKSVDLSALNFAYDDPGVMDYVVIAGLVRSPMGRFQTLFQAENAGGTCRRRVTSRVVKPRESIRSSARIRCWRRRSACGWEFRM